jgi:endoribonuclease Dicer
MPSQVEAYLWSLKGDCIIVAPTGSGRTLVGGLFLARMRRLNPNRLVVMVVDGVPLVFQQAKALEASVGLRSLALCSETRTVKSIEHLRKGRFGCVVATAGSLQHLLESGALAVGSVSAMVFDEVHHATGQHSYTKLLDLIAKGSGPTPDRRPRLLGLTASPVQARDYASARELLRSLRAGFRDAQVIQPASIPPVHQKVEYVEVEATPCQHAFQRMCCESMGRLLGELRAHAGEEGRLSEDFIRLGRWALLKGEARTLRDRLKHGAGREQATELIVWLAAAETCWLAGVPQAQRVLQEAGVAVPPLPGCLVKETSPRLRRLIELLCEQLRGGQGRALVFVESRAFASRLRGLLEGALLKEALSVDVGKVVGHGGWDGMDWQTQDNVLRSFRSGKTRVVVCTSVLEEGLDVPACDLAVQFRCVRKYTETA